MAGFVPVPNTLRVRSVWTDDAGTPHGVRQFFTYSSSAPTSEQLDTVASNVIAGAWPSISPQMSSEKTLTTVVIEDLTSDTAAVGTSVGSEPGTLEGDYLPANCVFSCQMTISRRYRGGHPRSALPFGVQASLVNAQQWTSAKVADFTSGFEAYIGNILGITVPGVDITDCVSVSYVLAGAPRVTPLVSLVTGFVGLQRVGSQRRRLGRSSG